MQRRRGLQSEVLASFALVWLGYVLARDFEVSGLVRWGVPALLAVFPLDAFFYVTPDALSPALGGLVFLLALRVALAVGGSIDQVSGPPEELCRSDQDEADAEWPRVPAGVPEILDIL